LQEGNTLLHGDYYPGSWMCSDKKLYIIDPEFSFIGFKEFDLGVMAAHLILATTNPDYFNRICDLYPTSLNQDYVRQLCGVEILRRLIGLAQLPLQQSLKEKQQLLSLAKDFIAS
jgi:5-methylthioribose kinase